MTKKNPDFSPQCFRTACAVKGITLRQLAFKCTPLTKTGTYDYPEADQENAYTELKRDFRKGTMSDRRLTIFAKELNAAKNYLRGEYGEVPFDYEHWSYDFGYWNELRNSYHDKVRDLIYFMPSYPTHFTYEEVQQLTDSDIVKIVAMLRPEIDRIVQPILDKRIYGINTNEE